MEELAGLQALIRTCEDVAAGRYGDDILSLTREEHPEPVRQLAESMAFMMVKVEAREYRLSEMIQELEALNRRIRANTIDTVSAMARALAARDAYTIGHAERVSELAQALARELGLDEDAIETIRVAGLLHDIGKIGFPDLLFETHGAKNPPEVVEQIMRHPAIGAEILKDLDFLGPALEFIHAHHERLDGKGYPRRLPAEQVPLGARIIAVADGYDAMTTDRPYQKGRTPQETLEILRRNAGTKWDGACIEAFARVIAARTAGAP